MKLGNHILRFGLLLAVYCAAMVHVFALSGKREVISVDFEASIDDQENTVTVNLSIEFTTSVSDTLHINGLLFDNTFIDVVKLEVNGEEPDFNSESLDGFTDVVLFRWNPPKGDVSTIEMSYKVTSRDTEESVHMNIPVLYINMPSRKGEDIFNATVKLSPELKIVESFPSANWQNKEEGLYKTSIPAVPSLVKIVAIPVDDFAWSFAAISDILVGVVLLVFLVLGWRKLKVAL